MFEASRQRGTRASVPTAAGRLIRPTNGSWPRSSATLTLLEDRRSVAARCPRSVYVRRNGHDDLGANDRFAVPDAGRLFIASATMQSHGSKIGLAAHLRERSVAHMEERLSRGRGCWPLSGWWWLLWLRLAGRSGRPRVRDGWSCSYSGAGYPKTFVRRTSAVYCRARRPGGRCSGDESRSCCARAGEARAASPAATGMSNRG
jgi:hypothetical protein